MSKGHDHTWTPAPELGMARYRCACGQVAYRKFSREITPYVSKHGPRDELRRPRSGSDLGGRVAPRPSLDDYDRNKRD